MSVRGPKKEVSAARLEAEIRKALADAWAHGATYQEATGIALQTVHRNYPETPEKTIRTMIQTLKG